MTAQATAQKKKPRKTMTDKQKIFVNYVKDGMNPTEAARKMGYKSPHVSAHFMAHNPLVRKAILDSQDYSVLKAAGNAINYLISVVNDQEAGDGARLKAAEIILKAQRDIASRLHSEAGDNNNLRNMSLDQLDRVVSALADRLGATDRPLIDLDGAEDVSPIEN